MGQCWTKSLAMPPELLHLLPASEQSQCAQEKIVYVWKNHIHSSHIKQIILLTLAIASALY